MITLEGIYCMLIFGLIKNYLNSHFLYDFCPVFLSFAGTDWSAVLLFNSHLADDVKCLQAASQMMKTAAVAEIRFEPLLGGYR